MNEGISKVIEFIEQHGILVLIAAVFMYVIIRLLGLLFKYLEKKVSSKNHDQLLDMRSTIGKEVQRLISVALRDCNASRIHVIEFSNSVMSIAYLPFKYMTCTYEVYKLGASATGHKIDKLSTSLFIPFFAALDEHDYCVFQVDDPDTPMGGAMIDLMKSQNEHQCLCAALKTPRGKHIGYVEMIKEAEFNDEDITQIQHLSHQIAALLGAVESK